jgi:hypothetical protein
MKDDLPIMKLRLSLRITGRAYLRLFWSVKQKRARVRRNTRRARSSAGWRASRRQSAVVTEHRIDVKWERHTCC